MPSSKGKPTDRELIGRNAYHSPCHGADDLPILVAPRALPAELREKIKNKLQKDNGGGWAAWMGAKLAQEYEAQGGGYENTGDNPNKAKKGTPEPKEGVERNSGGAAQTAKREKKEAEAGKKSGGGEKKDDKKEEGGEKEDGAGKKREANGKAEAAEEPKEKKAKANGGDDGSKAKKSKKAPPKEATKGSREQPKRGAKK